MKIVSLIDNHVMPITSLRAEAGEYFREYTAYILLRLLALINGNMKIVSLIDNHVMPITSLRAEAGEYFREYTAYINKVTGFDQRQHEDCESDR